MDDKLCNTSTIWSDPNSLNLADFLLDALLNGNFNQIPTPLHECSLALQLTNLVDSSLVTATILDPYCGPYLIDMLQGKKGNALQFPPKFGLNELGTQERWEGLHGILKPS